MTDNPNSATTELEVAARLEERPGNPAITPEGRMILSLHPFPYQQESHYRVVEVLEDGSTAPFPNEEWSTAPDEDGVGLAAVIGVQSDRRGVVWILDIGGGENPSPKLVAWDTRADRLHRVIHIPPHATVHNSFQQDLAIDEVRGAIFIADVGQGDLFGDINPAIVVVDLNMGRVWRALEGHPSLQPEDLSLVIEGRPVRTENPQGELEEPKIALDPIVIDPHNEWVYYGSLHGTAVFRIRAADLLDETLSKEELGNRIERYGEKAISDGISIDLAGNVYVTDLANNAIGVTSPDGSYHVLARDDRHCIWPDGMSYGPDGYFYVSVSQLHRSATLNAGKEVSETPFEVLRFRPLAPSALGR